MDRRFASEILQQKSTTFGVEAVIRWPVEKFIDLQPPGEFIQPIVEISGLVTTFFTVR